MDFYVNGEKIDVKLEDEKTIGDVLKSFEVTCEENNAAVIGISIDGKTITADIFDEESKKELSENTKFEFSIINVETIKDSFASLANLFNELSTKMEEVPVLLQKNETKLASESITKLADSINHFCHLAALASLFPETFTNTTIDGMNFNDFFMYRQTGRDAYTHPSAMIRGLSCPSTPPPQSREGLPSLCALWHRGRVPSRDARVPPWQPPRLLWPQ